MPTEPLSLLGLQTLEALLDGMGMPQPLKLLQRQVLIQSQRRQHLKPAIRQVVVRVKNSARELHQLSVVTEQQQVLHTAI